MNWRRLRLKYWLDLFGKKQLNQDLDEEIQAHIDMETRQRIDAGESPEAARMEALREIRSVALVKESTRDAWTWAALERVMQDIRYAARLLVRAPLFTLIVALSLAIGIGANTTLFSLADAMLLRKLPVDRPDDLVFFEWHSGPRMVMGGINGNTNRDPITRELTSTSFSMLAFEEFRRQSQTLASVFAFAPMGDVTVNFDGHPEVASGQLVSGNYFSGLGTRAIIGRTITNQDDQESQPVAVISHRYWQLRFASDPAVVGKGVVLNGVPMTIIGITPPRFLGALGFGDQMDVAVPLTLESQFRSSAANRALPNIWWLRVMGRLKPESGVEQVKAELERVLHSAAIESQKTEQLRTPAVAGERDFPALRVYSGNRGITDNARSFRELLFPLVVISAMLLLIVCMNVANLLLARATAREREIAVRLALGAGRTRVIRQLLTETLVLFAAGGAGGAALAYWGKDLITALIPASRSSVFDLRVDLSVLIFTAALSLLSAIVFGLVPAYRATSQKINTRMQQHARTLMGGGRNRLRKTLLVVQVALSLVLLVGAGLFVQTLWRLQSQDFGFNIDNLLIFQISPRNLKYDTQRTARLYAEVQESIAGLPGVMGATLSSYPLVSGAGDTRRISVEGIQLPATGQNPRSLTVRANFFDTIGAPIIAGRNLMPSDTAASPRVALINETFARTVFGAANPVGAHFGFNQNTDIEIVGVVRDVRISRAREAVPPAVFLPDLQAIPGVATFTVRTSGDPLLLLPAIRERIRSIDSNLPLSRVGTQQQQVQQTFTTERTFAGAAVFFGSTALGLACIGLFGLMMYSVERRMSEIGLRMALGARAFDVVQLVMRQSLVLVLLGTAIGIAGAFAAQRAITRVMSKYLFQITPTDPFTLAAAVAVLLAVGCLAAYLPARRASRVNPTIALRTE